jgi:hypothetical protein
VAIASDVAVDASDVAVDVAVDAAVVASGEVVTVVVTVSFVDLMLATCVAPGWPHADSVPASSRLAAASLRGNRLKRL